MPRFEDMRPQDWPRSKSRRSRLHRGEKTPARSVAPPPSNVVVLPPDPHQTTLDLVLECSPHSPEVDAAVGRYVEWLGADEDDSGEQWETYWQSLTPTQQADELAMMDRHVAASADEGEP